MNPADGVADCIDDANVQILARMLGITVLPDESEDVVAALRTYSQYGALLESDASTDALPSDDPRWHSA